MMVAHQLFESGGFIPRPRGDRQVPAAADVIEVPRDRAATERSIAAKPVRIVTSRRRRAAQSRSHRRDRDETRRPEHETDVRRVEPLERQPAE
jgi:hypothetical protein